MKGIVNIDISRIHSLLLTLLTSYQLQLDKFDSEVLYSVSTLQQGNYYVILGPADQHFYDAASYCSTSRADLFTVRSSFNLTKIFEHYSLDGRYIWTDLYYSKTSNTIVDREDRYPPVLATVSDVISVAGINLKQLDDTKAIILVKVSGSFGYLESLKTLTVGVNTLCIQPIPFPGKALERQSLTNLKKIFLVELNSTLKSLQTETELVELHIQQLPQIGSDVGNVVELTKVDQVAIENDIQRLTTLAVEIATALGPGGIKSDLDILVLSQKHSNLMAGVTRLTKVTNIPFFATALMLEQTDKSALNPDKEIRVSKINPIQFLIELIDKQDSSQNPENETQVKNDSRYLPDFWENTNMTKNDNHTYTEYGKYLLNQGYSMAMWGQYLLWSLFSFSSWDIILFLLTMTNLAANILALLWIKKLRRVKYVPVQVRQVRQVRFDRDRSFSESHATPPESREARVGTNVRMMKMRNTKHAKGKKVNKTLKRLAPPPPYSSQKRRRTLPWDEDDIRSVRDEDWGQIPLHRLPLTESMLSL